MKPKFYVIVSIIYSRTTSVATSNASLYWWWQGCANFGPEAEVLCLAERIRFWNGVANLTWVASELSNPQSLTHAAVARGPVWLRAFGPAVLHGCTPLDDGITN